MIDDIYTGLRTALAADSSIISALGGTAIYAQHAPPNQARPYIILQHMAGGDTNEDQGQPIDVRVMVKCVSDTGAQAGTIATLIRNRLHGYDTSLNLGTAFEAYRVQHTVPISFTETLDRVNFYHQGGTYRIRGNRI